MFVAIVEFYLVANNGRAGECARQLEPEIRLREPTN